MAEGVADGADPHAVKPTRTLDEYRYFRALAVDLKGRVPTRDEITQFERPGFELGPWVEEQLRGTGYVDRITRVYMDALRLEANPLVTFTPAPATLAAETIKDDRGQLVRVFYRRGQRRAREITDGDFCLSAAESGIDTTKARPAAEALPQVSRDVLEKMTTTVRPWWIYRDYRTPHASERIDESWTPSRYFQPYKDLLTQPDGKTKITDVRVCREEAQTPDHGTLWLSGRPRTPPPPGRTLPMPYDEPYAKAHEGEAVECASQLALAASIDCGCGVGLERCLPQLGDYALSFMLPPREPIGLENALNFGPNQVSHYQRWWWHQEILEILGHVLSEDRDIRELVTGKYTYMNGPLAQFYRWVEPSNCCGHERILGMMNETEPLVLPERTPPLLPHETDVWTFVPDRGPRAAGILTTAAFLEKFASRRARAAAAYTGLLCKNFVADASGAPPSKDPNLMVRPGCASCHATLEPLAAYFTHVKEGSMTFLSLHTEDAQCRLRDGKLIGYCPDFYDAPFSSASAGLLRGAYGSREHADAGPAALGAALAASPDYVRCAVDQVTSSFLGRPLTPDDEPLRERLLARFVESGLRMRTLVRSLVLDPVYAESRLGPSVTAPAPYVHPPISGGAP
jgi:hypothetical protein